MVSIQLRDGFSVARTQARDRIESAVDLGRLFSIIDSDPAIVGAGVVFIDSDFNVVTLREFQPICSVAVKRVILREAPTYMAAQEFARYIDSNVRESNLVMEVVGAVFACAGAYLSFQVVLGGIIAAPVTLGSSLVMSVAGAVSAVAGGLQCGIGILRVATEFLNPEALDRVDSEDWYKSITRMLDGITLVAAAGSIFITLRYVIATKAATGKLFPQILRELSSRERALLSAEIHLYRKDVLRFPPVYTNTQIREQTFVQLKDTLAASFAIGGSLVSGNLKPLAVGVYGEF
jgi:hypothetical protein